MSDTVTFQELILRLERFWADRGCVIWQPFNEKVGAGTMNPATVLRVLGPDAWNVGYVEPSFRPDDGRFGENPNRMQMHTQYQVILKPDPGNPQELYLDSLEALGLDREQHDIRFVEDNWESPALGAWGLGWEVWLDGMEITQFTYFQQAGGMQLEPVAVEITYGLERIAMYLQEVNEVWQLKWNDTVTYGDILRPQEVDYCHYAFSQANVPRLHEMYRLFTEEARSAIDRELVLPAHDYVMRCSHTFNLLDARGAIGVTERARYFAEMRDLSRQVAEAYIKQRGGAAQAEIADAPVIIPDTVDAPAVESADLLLEIGSEELPAADVPRGIDQLETLMSEKLAAQRLDFDSIEVSGTPRRLYALVRNLAGKQPDDERWVRGPAVKGAFDGDGNPTRALEGFCRGQGVEPAQVERREDDKGVEYVYAHRKDEGRPTAELLATLLPEVTGALSFPKTMRWDSAGLAYSRPVRWIVALYGDTHIPFRWAKVDSGRTSRGMRPDRSPAIQLAAAGDYLPAMAEAGILVRRSERREAIVEAIVRTAAGAGGTVPDNTDLLEEVTDLVEAPHALLGTFAREHLDLPQEVLITVMRKHQRYFPLVDADGKLQPCFITIANGKPSDPGLVVRGNEGVIRARYADAAFFFREDSSHSLDDYLTKLSTLTFQEDLGSVLDKVGRMTGLLDEIASDLGLAGDELEAARRAARICKADLATSMVVEMTSLQGVMGGYYALEAGETESVASAIVDHYKPRFPGDSLAASSAGFAISVVDRLDSLAGLFCAGIKPRATADPYGLRRDAIGLLANLIGHNQHFSLRNGLEAAGALLPVEADPGKLDDALEFILRRLEVQLRDEGFAHDVVAAAIGGGSDDPVEIRHTAKVLSGLIAQEGWTETLDSYARCKRIVRDVGERLPLSPESDTDDASAALHAAYLEAREAVNSAARPMDGIATALQALRSPITLFFDSVMVNADDENLRKSRLALVQHIAALPDGVADFTRLEGF